MTDSPSPGTAVKVALVSDVSTFPSGATSPTVYGAGGPPGGAVGSPGQKRSVSGTGNTLKVITDRTRTDICNYVSGKHTFNGNVLMVAAALVDQSGQEAQPRKSRRAEETSDQDPQTGQQA